MPPKRSPGVRQTKNSPVSAETSDSSKARKSTKQSDNEDESGKSARRGRPRVEQQDESAAEIRLAQRAYRERKETTIQELEKKVALLQGHLQQMWQAVGDFQHLAIDAGLESWNPALAHSLQEAVSNVRSLAEQNEPSSDDNPTATHASAKRAKTGQKRSHSPEPIAEETVEAELASHEHDWLPTMPIPDLAGAPWGYEFGLDDLEQISSTQFNVTTTTTTQDTNAWLNKMDPTSFPAKEHAVFTESWTTPLNKELTPIRSYNYAEKSFARRWHRYCYEGTYNMLTNPGTPPEMIHRALRYSLCFGSVRMIAQRIKYKLMRPANEPLEVWELPVLHVGGAGTHFPREGIDDSEPPPQGFAAHRNMGPWQNPVRTPADVYPYQVAQWLGIEGVWFDGYDVEQYLRTKGLYLDGTSALAKLELDENGQPWTNNNNTEPGLSSPSDRTSLTDSTTPRSPTSPAVEHTADLFANASVSVDQVLGDLSASDGFDFSLADPSATMDLDFPIYATSPDKSDLQLFPPLELANGVTDIETFMSTGLVAPLPPKKKKREVAIDVEKLIRDLQSEAICLGRSPGIKKDDVDKVLQKVVREAFEIF